MKRLVCFMFVLGIAFALWGCKQHSPETLEGEYGATQNGKLVPVSKVEKTATGYVFDDYHDGIWRTGDVAEPMGKGEFAKLTGAPVDGAFIGLKSKAAVVAKVQPGFTAGKFKTSTGYLMVFMFGPVELTKL
ncbi:hypothetical protein [Burkholderia pseudomallei]|uniref:hypothetical protein n=1 Tax=Burkholderia pseudomallei TaxID=28450 RepID=UPI000537540D|nr:hypothetical protein [Burkholderia pseudomallei]KGV62942.1 hypothetical protein X898_598 [Burkholderia pseudomallei ABCPW 91]